LDNKKEKRMSANQSSVQKSLSVADRLERKLEKIKAAERKKFLNENVVRLEKNGDLSYEAVRTYSVPQDSNSAEPNFYTETPDLPQNGQKFGPLVTPSDSATSLAPQSEVAAPQELAASQPSDEQSANVLVQTGISIHEADSSGQKLPPDDTASTDPLEDLLARALSRPRRGRPAAFDEHNKGKLVALLSLGMSLRQAAAVLGVSHGTIRNTLKADPALAEEITAARFQAQLQPLACVIREARRSWKAATWLLKYLDSKIASHEETPDERRERQQRETEEFLAHAHGKGVKTRHVLG
jgi:hypothetical protein